MAHVIEAAKSGRAACRKCKEKIGKGELRFGQETENQFGDDPSYRWFHLKCAAEKAPLDLSKALADYDGDVPDREQLDELIAKNKKKQKPSTFPYAERAPTGRSSCIVCSEKIEKDELRVAIEREVDAGGFSRMGAGYMHPDCVGECEEDLPADLMDQIRDNSTSLEPKELDELEQQLG